MEDNKAPRFEPEEAKDGDTQSRNETTPLIIALLSKCEIDKTVLRSKTYTGRVIDQPGASEKQPPSVIPKPRWIPQEP